MSGGERREGGQPSYLRRGGFASRLLVRAGARSFAVLFLGAAILHGLSAGGYLDDPRSPLFNIEGKLAGLIGQQAMDVRISGLKYHTPQAVLAAIGVRVEGSLIGFDPLRAKRLLENLDWVKKARLEKVYPNALRIELSEREPIVVWRTDGEEFPVDGEGVVIVSLDAKRFAGLLKVSGEGAAGEARRLVNHLEAWPEIKSKLRLATRVGKRRWDLHFASGLKVMMPEEGFKEALARLARLDASTGVLNRALERLDMRLEGRLALKAEATAGG